MTDPLVLPQDEFELVKKVLEALRRHTQTFTDAEGIVLCGGCLEPAPCPDAALLAEEPAP